MIGAGRLSAAACAAMLALAASGGGDEGDAAAAPDTTAQAAAPAAAPADTQVPAAAPAPAGALLDPNAATREELLAMPHFDATLADQVVAGRPYANMLDFDRVVAGRLTEQQRDEVYARVFKPLNLNTASGDEILLIPGIGDRMKHEFEEYRPYRNIEQFRREIGKYVNEAEVARLEKYVTL
ncbi:MAG TPA: hypothetical protein VFQ45_09975 [Longimicrobium sp.]|nr:hypothetical protein [Longimicrobium sp.]